MIDLASERLGGAAMAANDEFFAPKENLLKAGPAEWREGVYTERGKWMDGWETRRRREPGHDWCLIRLGLPGIVRGVCVDTTHFKGNFPQACSIEICDVAGQPDAGELVKGISTWTEVLPETSLKGDTENLFPIEHEGRVTHVRLHIYPDGGVARLRVYGRAVPDWAALERAGGDVDLAAAENGGLVLAASDSFFGSRHNLVLPGRGRDMSDGWETRRRRGPGHDWAVVQLGRAGVVRRVEVDTIHFKGNAPGACALEVTHAPEAVLEALTDPARQWKELLPRSKLQPDALHRFEQEVLAAGEATHARFHIFPDGGVSRLRLFGRLGAAAGPGGR
ncbi:MAG: allantoicase [Thermoanaerobaculia bacterium]